MAALFFDPPARAFYKVYGHGGEWGAGGNILVYGGYMYNVSEPSDLVGESSELGVDVSLGKAGAGARLSFTGGPLHEPWAWMAGWAPGAKLGVPISVTTTELLPWPW
jgi:hypothetical protein